MRYAFVLSLAAVASANSLSVGTIHDKSAPILSTIESESIPDSYIIKFKEHVDESAALNHHNWILDIHDGGEQERLELRKRSESADDFISFSGLKHTFKIGDFKGYAGHFHESVIEKVRNHPDIEFIERDTMVHTMLPIESQDSVTEDSCDGETEKNSPWGLARISHRDTLNFGTFNKYLYTKSGGEGVDAYVIDTGTNVAHVDFEDRAHWGKTIPSGDADEDGNGHGTHCSGTIAGKRYGVAKKAHVYAVKVLRSNGSGSMSDVVKGVEFAATSHLEQVEKAKNGNRKGFKGSVANMSLGGGKTQALDAAVNAAVRTGVHFAVAAGNDNADACNYSPAAAEQPVTVGASALDDSRAYFSNYGKCTDIFAPGLNIQSTWIGSEHAVNTISGTSMASPHIAGLLAYYLSLQPAVDSEYAVASITPKELKESLISIATENTLSGIPADTPNLLAWNGGGCSNYSKIVAAGGYKAQNVPSTIEELEVAIEEDFEVVSGKIVKTAKKFGTKAEKFSQKIHELVDEEIEQFLKEISFWFSQHVLIQQRRPLSRSKSTNSIFRSSAVPFEVLDPFTAERDAHIAAVLSYHRAQGRRSHEMAAIPRDPASFFLDRSDDARSSTGQGVESVQSVKSKGNGSASSTGIRRQQSVRALASRANDSLGASDVGNSSLHILSGVENRPASTMSRYLDSLQVSDQCYSTEDDIESVPSSFRRLRKPSTSLSVLKSRRFVGTSRSTSRAENDLAVHLAREKFREQVEGQSSLRSRPSTLFRSRNKRSDSSMGFRKSLRNSSNNSTVLSSAFSTHSLSVAKQPGLRKTARKGLFSRPKSPADPSPQDEDPGLYKSDTESCLHLEDGLAHHEASMFQVTSRVPSLHAVPSSQELRSRKGSVESIGSGEREVSDDKSRVTSWTNSITNTASSVSDLERQRLSIITENCTHGPMSSRPVSQHPLLEKGQKPSPGRVVDSQRVYSALMKRMEDIKRQEEALKRQIAESHEANRASANRIGSGERWGSSTIRCVRDHDDVFGSQDDGLLDDQFSSDNASYTEKVMSTPKAARTSENREPASTKRLEMGVQLPAPTTLTHRSSAFFASPTCHLFRTASPYRRALRESMMSSEEQEQPQEQPELTGSKYLKSLSTISLPTRRTSSAGSEGDPRMGYAESIYSSLTEDGKPVPPKVVPVASPAQSHGDATIFVDVPTYKPTPVHHQRDVSTASSVEWKTWLSAKVSKLEAPITPSKTQIGRDGDTLPRVKHVREIAEIDSPQETLRLTGQELKEPSTRSPLSPVEGNARSHLDIAMPRIVSSKIALPADENEAPAAASSLDCQASPFLPVSKPRSEINTPDNGTGIPRTRSLNAMGRLTYSHDESTRKSHARPRITGWHGSPAQSSPGLVSPVERASITAPSPAQRSGWNTSHSTPRTRRQVDGLESEGMGSKMMVERFLNSRRNRPQGGANGAGPASSPTAFI
ncbi:hypothetical protein EDB81DRAFT_866711 [Dactylonectria macrodidyma]|uniref:Uncharacterized protein n=1 Tax=Dactylonectria macrodidyma TaxID=307937 RepID=A0A9P9FE60_9HYPO|nr:hypothetical protein EDB81DRAFT_866711 [Dactylonectria macrodidyma]